MDYLISTLLFIKDSAGRFLLLKRAKAPNLGFYSPLGGKLKMASGESPFECVLREAKEEYGLSLVEKDLHLWGIAAEKAYEGHAHWLMFLFNCLKPVEPKVWQCSEGEFGFFSREEIQKLKIPESDHQLLWPNYDRYHKDFIALRADCHPSKALKIKVEQTHRLGDDGSI